MNKRDKQLALDRVTGYPDVYPCDTFICRRAKWCAQLMLSSNVSKAEFEQIWAAGGSA